MESLSELLVGELSGLRRFCTLLEEERNALKGAQADRLPDIAAEKSALAAQLSKLERQRDVLLVKDGLPNGRSGTEAWLANHPDAEVQRRQWGEILTLAMHARDGNEANGRLINILLNQNQDALAVLLSGGRDSIYGADGQSRGIQAGKRSFGAV